MVTPQHSIQTRSQDRSDEVPILRDTVRFTTLPKHISHLTLVCREGVPEGWTACRHPEGALYFVHGNSVSNSERYRISLLLYLKHNFAENVYGSEHMR